MDEAINIKNVTKKYKLYESTKERLLDLVSPKSYGENFYALKDVSFKANKGDVIGFIGINGSGKSTLSNIVAGIVPSTSGTVEVSGQTSLIAVSAGLKGDLTGRDNIELKCLMLGFTKNEIRKLEPNIIEFSELGQFIDQPVKAYSSGMKSRLGFAISVNVNPEVLIIDEALSVGDKAFAEKSLEKMKEFKKLGKTMIFVSHSIGQMKTFCEKILWLEFGRVKEFGLTKQVIPKYEKFLADWQQMSVEEREIYKNLSLNQDEKGMEAFFDASGDGDNFERLYSEEAVSRMGHINGNRSQIYQTPKTIEGAISSEEYKHSSYYIKKEACLNDKRYYLISNKPSGKEGVVGWIKSSNVSSHLHIVIDSDKKKFIIKGTGHGYNRPWGGRKNIIVSEMSPYKGNIFYVERTEKIGKNFWYYGIVDTNNLWLHEEQICEE